MKGSLWESWRRERCFLLELGLVISNEGDALVSRGEESVKVTGFNGLSMFQPLSVVMRFGSVLKEPDPGSMWIQAQP